MIEGACGGHTLCDPSRPVNVQALHCEHKQSDGVDGGIIFRLPQQDELGKTEPATGVPHYAPLLRVMGWWRGGRAVSPG